MTYLRPSALRNAAPISQRSPRISLKFQAFCASSSSAPATAGWRAASICGKTRKRLNASMRAHGSPEIRARYGTEPKISFFETVALTDKASTQAGGLD